MEKTCIIYGSSTGTCQAIAENIAGKLGVGAADVLDVSSIDASTPDAYTNLILGTSTWGAGELQDDWYDGLEALKQANLAGKTIAVQSTGKPEELFLSGSDPRFPQTVEVFSIEDRNVQYAMMACGYVDAIAAHETGILQYMKDNSVEFRILEEPLLVTGLGIAFAKNDSRGLDTQLNAVLAQIRTDGTLERIIGRYLENASQYLEVDTIGA